MYTELLLIYGFAFVTCNECESLTFDLVRCFEYFGDGSLYNNLKSIVSTGTVYFKFCHVADDLAECRNQAYSKCPNHVDISPYIADELSLRVMIYGSCRYKKDYEDGVKCFGSNFQILEDRAMKIFSNAFTSSFEREPFNVTDFCRKYSAKTRVLRNYIRTFDCPESFTTFVTQATITYTPLYCEEFKEEHTWLTEFLASESVINTSSIYMNLMVLLLRLLLR